MDVLKFVGPQAQTTGRRNCHQHVAHSTWYLHSQALETETQKKVRVLLLFLVVKTVKRVFFYKEDISVLSC